MRKTKKISRILSVLIVFALSFTSLFACSDIPDDLFEETKVEEGKTGLVVGVYDGALGFDFAKQFEKIYEDKNPNIDVIVKQKKNEYDDSQLVSKMQYSDVDIYFLSSNKLDMFTSGGLVADITDTVTEKIYDSNGNFTSANATKSIEDTMWQQWREIYKMDDGKYYAIPNFSPIAGLWYDADLFEAEGYTVPTTYQDFKKLLNDISLDNYVPITVSAKWQYIINPASLSFAANYEGLNNFKLNSTFSGVDSNLGEINLNNAYELIKQGGTKAMLQFVYDIAVNDRFTSQKSKLGQSHLESQDNFVTSINSDDRIAMIMENSFWEREAKATIDDMGTINSDWGWGKRNFKYMVAPVDVQNERQTIYMGYDDSFVCINANSKNLDLAKDFLQFTQSRESLCLYTQFTSTLRPYDYDFTEQEYSLCTPMTQSQIDLKRNSNVDFVTVGTTNSISSKIAQFSDVWFFGTSKGNVPFSAFRSGNFKTVEEYVSAVYEYNKLKYFN